MNDFELELRLLLEAIYLKYHYDFRSYVMVSLRRRLRQALNEFGCESLSQLQHRVVREPAVFSALLNYLTVQVSDMFRDPGYFLALREHVVPVLRTYPSARLWVAGCSTGEEVWSLAILLEEEGLLERALIYATDINPSALAKAEAGVYPLERVQSFTQNHQRAGGKGSLSQHYSAAYGAAAFNRRYRERMVFADHSLATDAVFAEVQLVSCRNVLIYFDRPLQDRALGLFHDALVHHGHLGLGAKESLTSSRWAQSFRAVSTRERLFQKA